MEKKHALHEDEVSDWLQILIAASSLDIKGNKAIKKKFVFLANRSVFPNMKLSTLNVLIGKIYNKNDLMIILQTIIGSFK